MFAHCASSSFVVASDVDHIAGTPASATDLAPCSCSAGALGTAAGTVADSDLVAAMLQTILDIIVLDILDLLLNLVVSGLGLLLLVGA